MNCFKLTLAYDGKNFAGWQWQPDRRTVQAAVEDLIQRVTGEFSRIAGSSRTDAGVHALAQVATFRSNTRLDPGTLRRALNAYAPEDLVVLDVAPVPDDFHPTRDAVSKRYRYVVQDGVHRDPFSRHYAWRVWQQLDVARMQEAARHLVGPHDFASFQTSGSERLSTIRTVRQIEVLRPSSHPTELGQGRAGGRARPLPTSAADSDRVWIEVEADGFLYNMVRNITGTLVTVGKGSRPPEWVAEVLAARDRRRAGMTAPPEGLYLIHIDFAPSGTGRTRRDPNTTPPELLAEPVQSDIGELD